MEKIIENMGVDAQNTATEDELEKVAGGGQYLKNECRICGACFRNSKELKQHLQLRHPNDPRARW